MRFSTDRKRNAARLDPRGVSAPGAKTVGKPDVKGVRHPQDLERGDLWAMPDGGAGAQRIPFAPHEGTPRGQLLNQLLQIRAGGGETVAEALVNQSGAAIKGLESANEPHLLQEVSLHGWVSKAVRAKSDDTKAIEHIVDDPPMVSERLSTSPETLRRSLWLDWIGIPMGIAAFATTAIVLEPFALLHRLVNRSPGIDRRVSLDEIREVIASFHNADDMKKAAMGLGVCRWMQEARSSDLQPDARAALLAVIEGYQDLPKVLRDDVRQIIDAVSLARITGGLACDTTLHASDLEGLLNLWRQMSPQARTAAWALVQSGLGEGDRADGADRVIAEMEKLVPPRARDR